MSEQDEYQGAESADAGLSNGSAGSLKPGACDEQQVTFLSSAEELDGIDFGFSGAALARSFQAGGEGSFDEDTLGDETTVLSTQSGADDLTTILDVGNEPTTVLPDARAVQPDENATTVLELPVEAEKTPSPTSSTVPAAAPSEAANYASDKPDAASSSTAAGASEEQAQKKLPVAAIAVIAAVVLVLAIVLGVVLSGAPEEEDQPAIIKTEYVEYTVSCLDRETGNTLKSDSYEGASGESVEVYPSIISGYELMDVKPPENVTAYEMNRVSFVLDPYVSEDTVFYYAKPVTYKVRYLDKDTKKPVRKAKTVEGNYAGDAVSATAPKVKGYKLASHSKKKSLELSAKNSKNVITFYYKKVVASSSSSTSSSSSSSGGSYVPSYIKDYAVEA